MFENLQAVAGNAMPVIGRGGGSDIKQTADYKALAGLALNTVVSKPFPSPDEAKKAQARINLYARSGAGTFKTKVHNNTLFLIRTSEEYRSQRNRGETSFL